MNYFAHSNTGYHPYSPVPRASQNGLAVPSQREQQSFAGLNYMTMQGGNRPQEFTTGYTDGQRQQWQINSAHRDTYWYDARC
jgi:hypothetical protein